MPEDLNKDLFNGISDFGLDNLNEMSVYSNEEEIQEKEIIVKSSPLKDAVYEKKVTCPVCLNQITVRAVKSSKIRITVRDSDFMNYYNDPNPMYYDVWLCPLCGYAAMSNKFNIITEKQRKLIKDNITAKWKLGKVYPLLHDFDVAIELHQLALLNSVVKQSRDSEKAFICLKLAWLYRIKKDLEQEKKFLYQAQLGFIKAIDKESFPIVGLDFPSLEYLIGEICRRLEDNTNALRWFSRVLTNQSATPKIKDMVRSQRELIKV